MSLLLRFCLRSLLDHISDSFYIFLQLFPSLNISLIFSKRL